MGCTRKRDLKVRNVETHGRVSDGIVETHGRVSDGNVEIHGRVSDVNVRTHGRVSVKPVFCEWINSIINIEKNQTECPGGIIPGMDIIL